MQTMQSERNSIKDIMEKKGRKSCKKSGVSAFDASEKEFINNFIESMSKYGILFVPVGELECWLASLHVERKKNQWLTRMFMRLGSDPTNEEYVRPSTNDIWAFIDKAAAWIKDPKRLGIPD